MVHLKEILMIKLTILTLLFCSVLATLCLSQTPSAKSSRANGFVPNEETAIKVAEAIWLPIYGKKIYDCQPFVAKLRDDQVWIVQGTLKTELGGVPYAEIQKSDCKVLKITHTK
jgi:hypothetical protein